ncbi:hypothetical protein THASP1DRAFT_27047 [Thamnocephalis sphaerospora]|uniref:Uncharacterized protein n=1 Tax=Thamnocephalis sphaerospora TaxID=78915 RepID=A0A4V1IXI8_9FUNG|nr:hypothetical protein THASP1DRAFT_27047 [Thamnocephalis sphaerospora]|eukprot:RKP11209.1 hypothetical protein THASP1DRAFT_27047 [Thamnocephalis sphaerospora]
MNRPPRGLVVSVIVGGLVGSLTGFYLLEKKQRALMDEYTATIEEQRARKASAGTANNNTPKAGQATPETPPS